MFRQDPVKFSTGRFEVSIARAANVDEAVNYANTIWTEESRRIDMVIVPYRLIETKLENMAQLPSVQGVNTASVDRVQVSAYVWALN